MFLAIKPISCHDFLLYLKDVLKSLRDEVGAFINEQNQIVKRESSTWRGSSWFMLMKEMCFSYAGWEPPFIHHMVKPGVYSRHFRNLTMIPKLIAIHNSSTWLCFLD